MKNKPKKNKPKFSLAIPKIMMVDNGSAYKSKAVEAVLNKATKS